MYIYRSASCKLLLFVLEFKEFWTFSTYFRRIFKHQSNYKLYVYIVRHNYVLGGMLFTICKAKLHVSAINVGHLHAYNENLSIRYTCICRGCIECRGEVLVRDLASVWAGGAWLWAG